MSVVLLAGGVGGAKLADGLARCLGRALSVVVNTGDDFEHLGLAISPDLDTVTYTLAGIANPETGWGVAAETWSFLDQLGRLGGPSWFRLGDRDLAMHVLRSERLRRGESLTRIAADLCRRLGIESRVLPMSDDPVRTIVETAEGDLAFQDYFVRRRCDVAVRGFRFDGAAAARPGAEVEAAIADPDLSAILIGPSNPFISIAPILSVPGLEPAVRRRGVPVVAVSPIIAGAAVKGPLAKMMGELGLRPSPAAIATHYGRLLSGFVIDEADAALAPQIETMGIAARVAPTLMRDGEGRERLARQCLAFAADLSTGRRTIDAGGRRG